MRATILGFVLLSVLVRYVSSFRAPTSLPKRISRRGWTGNSLYRHPYFLGTAATGGRKKRLATGMAFLTGWADLALFRRYKTFATMMTGNAIWLANAVTQSRYSAACYYASVIASYIVGLSLFRRMDLQLRKQCLRACALIVTALFVGSDIIQYYTQTQWIPVLMLASAYGIINSIGIEVSGTLTFVITGHMTKLTHQGVDRFSRKRGRKKLTDDDKAVVVQNSAVVAGFFGGALFA